ncbi:polyhydroxyalkanoate synthesis regulator DNA-binding domain-containing protein [Chloroflexota bacterium]
MRVIKRYSNRKLYDTTTKQYITLDQIAELVREGEELQVVENTSGEDLTALTLSNIIVEQEKKQKGFIPRSVLNALVEAGGKPISSLRQRLESPLGFLHQVDDEIERRIQSLIQRGEIAEEHGRKLRDQLMALSPFSESVHKPFDEDLQRILQKQGIPSNDDIQNLIDQIETLSEKINSLE